jgi:RimJ/RimL family protein N-acetyltransferase
MIEGKLVRLRAPERGDIPTFVKWINDPEVTEFLKLDTPISMEEEEVWYAEMVKRKDRVFSIETLDGRLIGNVGLVGLDWESRRTDIGIMIGEKDAWSKGYGTDAVMVLLGYLFDELNLNRVSLFTDANNTRAQRCYEKCGFKKEGVMRQYRFKRGRYLDGVLYSILKEEWKRTR